MQSLVSHIHFDAVFHFAAKALILNRSVIPECFFQYNVASGIVMLEVLALRDQKLCLFIFCGGVRYTRRVLLMRTIPSSQ